MAPRKSNAKKAHLISSSNSMTALGQWIQQSTESLTRATHPLMSQMRSAFPAGANELEAEAPAQPGRQRRGSQMESSTLAAALRSRGGAPTKKASTPPLGNSPQPGHRHRRATAPVPAATTAQAPSLPPLPAMREDPFGGATAATQGWADASVVPPLPLDRSAGNRAVMRHLDQDAAGPGGSSQVTGAAGFVAQIDEFFRRGTPRAAAPQPVPATGCPRGASASTRLEHRLANWVRTRGLPPSAAPRLVATESLAPARSECGDRPLGAAACEASILWRGVGVDILLEGGLAVSTSGAEPGDSPRVASAHTDCGWANARLGVAIATERAAGLPLEAFLDALWQAWQQAAASPEAPIDSAGIAMAKGCTTVGAGTDSCALLAGGGGCQQGSGARARSASPGLDSTSSFGSSSTRSCTEVGPGNPRGAEPRDDSFADWLWERPPLWRFDHASRGLAWDFPASKAEKREYLLLQLFAEEGERQAQLATLREALPLAHSGSKAV